MMRILLKRVEALSLLRCLRPGVIAALFFVYSGDVSSEAQQEQSQSTVRETQATDANDNAGLTNGTKFCSYDPSGLYINEVQWHTTSRGAYIRYYQQDPRGTVPCAMRYGVVTDCRQVEETIDYIVATIFPQRPPKITQIMLPVGGLTAVLRVRLSLPHHVMSLGWIAPPER